MLPIKLRIYNFCCYEKAEIDFSLFTIALIVGKMVNNEKLSNGSGKSTIFNAIKYVLFNETSFSTLDKIVRRGSNSCSVEFEFDVNGIIYKIIRSKALKSGTDVRLFRKNEEIWEDLTQRKATDTDKDIIKLIKINYKTFSNSVLFSQLDLSGLASQTPGSRKSALKDALQLHIYSKYESLAKDKRPDLNKKLNEICANIKILSIPKEEADKIIQDIIDIEQEICRKNIYQNDNIKNLEQVGAQLNENINRFKNHKEALGQSTIAKNKLINAISQCSKELSEYENKISNIRENAKEIDSKIKQAQIDIDTIKYDVELSKTFKNEILSNNSIILEKSSHLKSTQSTIVDLSIPMPSDAICKHCRQHIDIAARDICKKSIEDDLATNQKIATDLSKEIEVLHKRNNELQRLISVEENKATKILLNNNSILRFKLEIENKKSLYVEYKNIINSKKESLDALTKDLSSVENKLNEMNVDEISKLKSNIEKLENQHKEIESMIKYSNNQIVALSNTKAILLHKQEQNKENIKTLENLSKTKSDLEKNIMIHEKVIQGFGSSGIPALIIHNILDDLQADTNMFLSELRPGMQVLFSIIKDRDDGQQEDTLKIDFMINGIDLEYEQLSGAQKIIAALSLKLGLLSIIKKRFGVDIKLLMIDEVDQSLDDGSLESFEFAIKKLQKDYKVLIITHNKELKNKFGQYILVEQNENLISTAKVVNAW